MERDPYEAAVQAIVRDVLALVVKWRGKRKLKRYGAGKKAFVARQTMKNWEDTLAGAEGALKRGPLLAMVARLWLALEIPGGALGEIFRRHAALLASSGMD